MKTLAELNDMVAEVAPIFGINTTGVIWFKPEATDEEKLVAQALMDEHLPAIKAALS